MIWLRYVTLGDVGRWLAAGWTIDDDLAGTHHGRHAVLMRWVGAGAVSAPEAPPQCEGEPS